MEVTIDLEEKELAALEDLVEVYPDGSSQDLELALDRCFDVIKRLVKTANNK